MNTAEEIKRRIRKVLINDLGLSVDKTDLQAMENLEELFIMDSIMVIELVIGLEKEFEMEMSPECLDIETLKDIPSLALCIEKLLREEKRKITTS